MTDDGVALVDAILKYAGSDVRGPGLYGSNQDITSKLMINEKLHDEC